MIRYAIILFFVLLFVGPAFGQAPEKLFVGNCSFSGFALVSDSTYTGDIIRFDDRMGDGYNLTQLQAGDEIFDGRGLVFEIDVVNSATNFTANVTVTAKVDRGFEPFGSGQVYRPTASGLIPPSSQEQAGLSPTQKARIDRHNVVTMQTLVGVVVDSTRLIQDSILVYYQGASEVGRDTISGTGGGGGSTETADGLTILGDGGGTPFYVNTDSLHPPMIYARVPETVYVPGCASTVPINISGMVVNSAIRSGDDITGDITISGAGGLTITYIQEEDGFAYFEAQGNLAAGIYGPELAYSGVTLSLIMNVIASPCYTDSLTSYVDRTELGDSTAAVRADMESLPADNVTGTGASPRVALWTAAQTIGSSANLSYTSPVLTLAGTGNSLLLTPSSAGTNVSGKWYTSSTNRPRFMDGATDWPLVRGSAESFTTGIMPFAGTSGQLTESTTYGPYVDNVVGTFRFSRAPVSPSAYGLYSLFNIQSNSTTSNTGIGMTPSTGGGVLYATANRTVNNNIGALAIQPYGGQIDVGTLASATGSTFRVFSTLYISRDFNQSVFGGTSVFAPFSNYAPIVFQAERTGALKGNTTGAYIHNNTSIANAKSYIGFATDTKVFWMIGHDRIGSQDSSIFRLAFVTSQVGYSDVNAISIDPRTKSIGAWVDAPAARLHLPAGTSTAGTASLKIAEGVNTSSPQDGEINHVSDRLNFTTGSTVNVIAHLTDIPDQNATYYEETERQYTLSITGADTLITIDTLSAAIATDSISISNGLIENLRSDTVRWQVRYDFFFDSDEDPCYALMDLTTDGTEEGVAIPGSAARAEQVSASGGQMPGRTFHVDVPPGEKIRLCVKGSVGVSTSMNISYLTISIQEINR